VDKIKLTAVEIEFIEGQGSREQ